MCRKETLIRVCEGSKTSNGLAVDCMSSFLPKSWNFSIGNFSSAAVQLISFLSGDSLKVGKLQG